MERIPPNNQEAEQSVLGAAMLDKDALFDVLEKVRAEDFYDSNNREIFESITGLQSKGQPVDILTVCEELKKRNSLDMVGGRGYVGSLPSAAPSTSNAGEYARIVSEKAELRRLIGAAGDIMEKSFNDEMDAAAVLDDAERSILDIAGRRESRSMVPLKEILLEDARIISERMKNRGGLTGVTSGFLDLDEKTSGFQRSDLIILAARPSMGKTAFALSVARNAAAKDARIVFFSLEMSKEQLSQRLISMESGVDLQKLRTGELDDEDWKNITASLNELSTAAITIDDTPGISLMEIKNKCRRMKAEKGLDLILLDYMQLLNYEGGRAESRQQEITAISRALKQLAREMNCPVIVLSQLSRAPEQRTNDHRPILSDLRESGSIEQDADVVLFLYRDEVYDPDTESPGICEVNIAKQRNGPTGPVEVRWQSNYTRFVNKDKGGYR